MSIQLIADSCCDTTPELQQQLGLVKAPLKINIAGGKTYIDDGGVDIPAITDELASRFYALEVRDRTTVRRDIWDGCGDDSLRGLFLQKMRQRYDAAQDDAERRTVQQAVRFALAAMENRDM